MNVCKTLLHGTENRRFRLTRQPLKTRGDFQIHFDLAAFGESIDVPVESGRKSRFVEQRWMEQVGDGADLSTEFLYQSRTVVNRTGSLGEAFDVGSHRRKVHSEGGQHLAYAVVQLAGDAPSLIILQLHQTRREFAQILIAPVELCRALVYRYSQLSLRCPQHLFMATAGFSHGQQDS